MTSSVPHRPALAEGSPFEISRPSPLPLTPERDPEAVDPIALAEQELARIQASGGSVTERTLAWLALADAWLSLDAVGPALVAVRRAVEASPAHPEALDRLAVLASRAGSHRLAAETRDGIARAQDAPTAWETAVRAWLRAGEPTEAEGALAELLRRSGDDPRARALELSVLRIRGGPNEALVARLLDAAVRARRHDDREGWRVHAADAWLESRGAEGGEIFAEALAASGRPRAAVYVAAEAAARALPAEGAATEAASRLLVRCARLAENAAMPGEATAAWSVGALLGDAAARDARESLRDLLAERGRAVDLAARLRADARRAPQASRAAAWKGVAAIEIPQQPSRAAFALAEALRLQPDDAEAMDLLDALATNPASEEAVRDALWELTAGPGVGAAVRSQWLLWLGELEQRAGDAASAERAYILAGNVGTASAARVASGAAALRTLAEQMLGPLEHSEDHGASSADHLLASLGKTPGAFTGLKSAGRVLGAMALHDDRVAGLWVRVARRSEEAGHLVTVLRRVATRCTAPTARVAAAVECAEILDLTDGPLAAAELLTQLLDELPEEPAAAATLSALAEHANDPTLARDALRAAAKAAVDPWERDMLTRFTGTPQGIFAVFASCLAEPTASRDRSTNLARLHDLLGDCYTLLAGRTRSVLAQTGPADDGIDVARRFAAFDPASPEATIAWFGASSLAGDAEQVVAAATAVAVSLASARDLAAVSRTALARLAALGAERQSRDFALVVSRTGALFDRPLRAAVAELCEGSVDVATRLRLMESVAACAQDALAEQETALRRVAGWYRLGAHMVGELRSLERVLSIAPADRTVFARVLELSACAGDGAIACRLLEAQLAEVTTPAERRTTHLALVVALMNTVPPRMDEAVAALDRYAAEARTDAAQGEVARALLAMDLPDLAVDRLARWTSETLSEHGAAVRAMAGAQVAHERLNDANRALAILRSVLGRASHVPEVLLMAERIAVEADARAAMLAIYDDLAVTAAGDHGRHALAYRRAAFLERTGDHTTSLAEHLALFERAPSLGASFSAIERIVETTGRYEILAHCLALLAGASGSPETRSRYYLRAAEVARTRGRDLRTATGYELEALRAQPDASTDALVVEHARLLRASDPEGARTIFHALADDALAAGNQAWEDEARQALALRAAELAASEANDPYRLAAAVALYLRGHEDLAAGREVVTALLNRTAASPALREAAEAVPAMAMGHNAPDAAPPAEPAPARVDEAPAAVSPPAPAETPAEAPSTARPHLELVMSDSDPPATPDLSAPAVDPEAARVTPVAKVSELPAAALREAFASGDDEAAAALAERLATSEDALDEALAIQRRRLTEDPARLDALAAMASLYTTMQMPAEAQAMETVLAVLTGRASTVQPPDLHDLAAPHDGVARVLAPADTALFTELGALVWEARGTPWRREAGRVARESDRPWVDPASEVARMVTAALRLLQLPRSTPWTIRDDVPSGVAVLASHPPGIALSVPLSRDTPRARYLVGRALEGTRTGNVLAVVLDGAEGARVVAAIEAAFGEVSSDHRVDAAVARLATLLQDGIPARSQRRMREIVSELGPRLTWASWCKVVETARMRAGMLLSGDYGVAAMEVLAAADANAEADPRKAIRSHEPLRDLTRFATSKEYLLLRWQVDEAARRRRGS